MVRPVMGCVQRDAEHHAITREVGAMRFGPGIAAWLDTLGHGLTGPQRAMLRLATSFQTWRTLAREAELASDDAVSVLVQGILHAQASVDASS